MTSSAVTPLTIAQLLSAAQQDAKRIGDKRLESYALGKLGHLYEQTQQYPEAQRLTQQALNLVDPQIAGEVAYQWQWQLGRIAKSQGELTEAIASYQAAVNLLSDLRQDLVSSNPDSQFSFQERVEPLYREYVSLLLSGPEPSSPDLEKARQSMEALQLAELDNFFRAACIDVTPVNVDQVDPSAAIIYPIVLQDKVAVVVRLPGKPLKLYLTPVNQPQLELVVDRLRLSLTQTNSQSYLEVSQRLYDWLLRPAIADIESSQVKTMVFVPDGVLRNIPMGVLHDGDRFLIENYAIAITPGLQLFQAGVGRRERSQALVAGISKAQSSLPPLPHVEQEVAGITQKLRNQTFMNESFTPQNLAQASESRSFPIIHIATHGQFSSDEQGTFLHAWGEKMSIDQLRQILRDSELRHRSSLELLVLSACQTAVSDRRAILGLAGIAARSGAKSTLASLWMVSDESTALLMEEFYDALSDPRLTKAEALQQAQKLVMKETHPYFWSAFVLVGNWQ
jgi:CHAT domain-containing protein